MIPLRDDNPSATTPYVTWAVMAGCILAFLWQQSLDATGARVAVYAFGSIPAVLFGHAALPPEVERVPAAFSVVTSMFLHGGWMHLIGNMLYLWIFGDNVEDSMGHARYAAFYLLAGVAAALAQALPDTASAVPMIGASGAISGVLGAYAMLFPRARVLVLIPLGVISHAARMPAAAVLGLWFGLQLLQGALAGDSAGVAFGAHIGGFVAGLALVPVFSHRKIAWSRG